MLRGRRFELTSCFGGTVDAGSVSRVGPQRRLHVVDVNMVLGSLSRLGILAVFVGLVKLVVFMLRNLSVSMLLILRIASRRVRFTSRVSSVLMFFVDAGPRHPPFIFRSLGVVTRLLRVKVIVKDISQHSTFINRLSLMTIKTAMTFLPLAAFPYPLSALTLVIPMLIRRLYRRRSITRVGVIRVVTRVLQERIVLEHAFIAELSTELNLRLSLLMTIRSFFL